MLKENDTTGKMSFVFMYQKKTKTLYFTIKRKPKIYILLIFLTKYLRFPDFWHYKFFKTNHIENELSKDLLI